MRNTEKPNYKKYTKYLTLLMLSFVIITYFAISKLNDNIEYLKTNIIAGVGGSGWAFFVM